MGFSAEAGLINVRRNIQWIVRKSDTSEGHVDRPPEGQYDTGRRTEEGHDEDGVEELGFPHKTLERAVTQLRQELNDYLRRRRLTDDSQDRQVLPRPRSRGTRENLIGNSTVRNLKQLCV